MSKNYLKFNIAKIGMMFILLFAVVSCKEDPAPVAVAGFDYDATTDIIGQAPLNVQFTNSSTNAISYAWDFGDGSTSIEKDPAHSYAKGGVYTVKLTVKNADQIEVDDMADLELASPLVGTWALDSAAENTIDTLATKVKGAMEFGDKAGWDGDNWLAIAADGPPVVPGYSTFWSNVIFSGNYLGRKTFFNNEFTFTVDGEYQRDLKGSMPALVYFAPENEDLKETEDWGVFNPYKSNSTDYSYSIQASTDFAAKKLGEVTLSGATGAFCGIYFAGNAIGDTPQATYTYTISKVTDTELILFGVNNLFGNDKVIFVLKFKKLK